LRGRRSHLLNGTARSALGSTGLGVAAMIVATALMNGYTEDLQDRMLTAGALVAIPIGSSDAGETARAIERIGGIEDVSSVSYAVVTQGAISTPGRPQASDVVLRGVVPGQGRFSASAAQLERGLDRVAGAVLGKELARRLGVATGDLVQVVMLDPDRSGQPFRFFNLRVSGTFELGFAQFDQGYAIVDQQVVEGSDAGKGLWEVAVDDADRIDAVKARLEDLLGDDFVVRDWRQSNPGLFTALRLQKWALFLMLGLIVVVSTFNVASTLIVLVRERMRDIGTLLAMGLRPAGVRALFVLCGVGLGVGGTVIGVVVGAFLSWLLTEVRLLRFPPEVAEIYFIDSVPFRVHAGDLVLVAAFTVAVTVLASFVPAYQASRIEPAQCLRYE
jgi:lipoprotein-releasing system permease protein